MIFQHEIATLDLYGWHKKQFVKISVVTIIGKDFITVFPIRIRLKRLLYSGKCITR